MGYSIGTPVVSANIVTGDTAVAVAIGDGVSIVEMRGASEREVAGTVIGIELGNKPNYGKRAHEIYDGIPVSEYDNPVATMIANAADVMEVNALLIEVTDTETTEDQEATPVKHHVRVNVGFIKTIAKNAAGGDDTGDTGAEEPVEP